MQSAILLLCLSLLSLLALADEVTIFGVQPTVTPDPSVAGSPGSGPDISFSPVGTGSDGVATYDVVFRYKSDDQSLHLPDYTYHATYLAANTQLVLSGVGADILVDETGTSTLPARTQVNDCSWGEERVLGTCVFVENGTPLFTVTGTVGPAYTVTVENMAVRLRSGRNWVTVPALLSLGVVLGIGRLFA